VNIEESSSAIRLMLHGPNAETERETVTAMAGKSYHENLAETLQMLGAGGLQHMLTAIVTQAVEGSPSDALEAARALCCNLGPVLSAAGDELMEGGHG
jgi:hypothetical protein